MSCDPAPAVTIYTDGGANPNPGAGGWGAVLIDESSGRRRELAGGEPRTTNNRMELLAAIRALESLKRPCRVQLYTDSQYLRRGVTEWLPGWRQRGWKRKQGEILNLDLWQRIAALASEHQVDWHWVKGHAGNADNERADALAAEQIRRHGVASDRSEPADAEVFLKITCAGGRGAWAALVRQGDDETTRVGRRTDVTSNQLDLHAAAEVLKLLPPGSSVVIHTASDYLRKGASQWLANWRRRGWKTREGGAVKNVAAWRRLDAELGRRRVRWSDGGEELAEIVKQRLAPLFKTAHGRADEAGVGDHEHESAPENPTDAS